jgi:hypothetical protein
MIQPRASPRSLRDGESRVTGALSSAIMPCVEALFLKLSNIDIREKQGSRHARFGKIRRAPNGAESGVELMRLARVCC